MTAGSDRRLRALLVCTVALSVVGYLAVPAAVLGAVALAYLLGGTVHAAGVATVLAVGSWVAARSSTGLGDLLDRLDAGPVGPAEAPRLHAAVERIAAQYDAPAPDVWVADTADPNAMAVQFGLRDDGGAVVVTEGLLEEVSDAELDAVVAHELAHLVNRDAVALSWAKRPSTYLGTLARFGLGVGVFAGATGGLVLASSAGAVPTVVGVAYLWLVVVPLALGLLLTPVAKLGRRVVRSLGRSREFAADAAAARATDPAALAGALRRLDEDLRRRDASDLREASLGEFYLLPVDDDQAAYHPDVAARIARLERLAA
jgi:heat shock protein HtpX